MNIFLLPEGLGDEDRFTAHLHYLIECVPGVGQAMVDKLLGLAGRPSSTFTKSEDAVLGARIYVNSASPEVAAFRQNELELQLGRHRVRTRARDKVASWNPELSLVFEYLAPLGPVLSEDVGAIQESLLEFAKGVFEHCQSLVRV